jgi:hypothetical protein
MAEQSRAQRRRSSRRLEADKIVQTLEQLSARIAARFPDAGLTAVCAHLTEVARLTVRRVARLSPAFPALRVAAALVIAGAAVGVGLLLWRLDWSEIWRAGAVGLAEGLDAAVNLALLSAGAAWFLLTLDARWRVRQVRRAMNELRSIAHVVDMHQLTKDPTIVLGGPHPTSVSPKREMSRFELARYLDYCTEMLALIAKLAALYTDRSLDPAVGQAVNEIESLTSDLGRKIWQKIMILGELEEHRR